MSNKTVMNIVPNGRKYAVTDAETGIILRTLETRDQAEAWRAEASRPSPTARKVRED